MILFEGQNGYITASYIVTAIVFAALVIWILQDRKKQKKALAALEAQGISRKKTG